MSYNDLYKGRHSQKGCAYFVTTNLADRKQALFSDFRCARIIVQTLKALHDNGKVHSLAWVVMPDHLHWLFILTGENDLSSVIKLAKATSANSLNRHLHKQGALWQKGFFDHGLRQEEDIKAIARYIVANPLRAGLVKAIGDYPHWDVAWL